MTSAIAGKRENELEPVPHAERAEEQHRRRAVEHDGDEQAIRGEVARTTFDTPPRGPDR